MVHHFGGFSNPDLFVEQAKDTDLHIILDWLNNAVVPGQNTLFLSSPASKSYWLSKEQFTLIGGVLFRNRNDSNEEKLSLTSQSRGISS